VILFTQSSGQLPVHLLHATRVIAQRFLLRGGGGVIESSRLVANGS
jgi:hypothetical protein